MDSYGDLSTFGRDGDPCIGEKIHYDFCCKLGAPIAGREPRGTLGDFGCLISRSLQPCCGRYHLNHYDRGNESKDKNLNDGAPSIHGGTSAGVVAEIRMGTAVHRGPGGTHSKCAETSIASSSAKIFTKMLVAPGTVPAIIARN